MRVYTSPGEIRVELDDSVSSNTVELYNMSGSLLYRMSDRTAYTFSVPSESFYLLSVLFGPDNRRINRKIVA